MKSCKVTRRYGDCEDGSWASAVAALTAAAADGAGKGLENDVFAVVAVVAVVAEVDLVFFMTYMFLGMFDDEKNGR